MKPYVIFRAKPGDSMRTMLEGITAALTTIRDDRLRAYETQLHTTDDEPLDPDLLADTMDWARREQDAALAKVVAEAARLLKQEL